MASLKDTKRCISEPANDYHRPSKEEQIYSDEDHNGPRHVEDGAVVVNYAMMKWDGRPANRYINDAIRKSSDFKGNQRFACDSSLIVEVAHKPPTEYDEYWHGPRKENIEWESFCTTLQVWLQLPIK